MVWLRIVYKPFPHCSVCCHVSFKLWGAWGKRLKIYSGNFPQDCCGRLTRSLAGLYIQLQLCFSHTLNLHRGISSQTWILFTKTTAFSILFDISVPGRTWRLHFVAVIFIDLSLRFPTPPPKNNHNPRNTYAWLEYLLSCFCPAFHSPWSHFVTGNAPHCWFTARHKPKIRNRERQIVQFRHMRSKWEKWHQLCKCYWGSNIITQAWFMRHSIWRCIILSQMIGFSGLALSTLTYKSFLRYQAEVFPTED